MFEPWTFVRLVYRKIRQRFLHRLPAFDGDEKQLYSPFENVTGKEMIDYFIEAFGQQQVVFETTVAFGMSWLARIRGPRKLRLAIVAVVKKIDDYLIRRGIVEGEYVFIEATKS